MKKSVLVIVGGVLFAMILLPFSGYAAHSGTEATLLADVVLGSTKAFFPLKNSDQAVILSVSRPDGTIFSETFSGGKTPVFVLGQQNPAGIYSWEIRAVNPHQARSRGNEASQRNAGLNKGVFGPALVQNGSFMVRDGVIMTDKSPENLSSPLDVLHYDDVIITGSLCVGFDCSNGESFGYCTQKYKENNLQVCFEDTSIGSFPTNDWKIQINDTTSGGASYFTIWDTDGGRRPFTIEAGAPAHSLYVEDYGRVGLGTSIPYVELHIVDGDSPTVRLDQDGSSGWAAQRWDLCGNETNFFLRDVTNGSKLCMRVQPNTPSNTLCLRSSGNVGIGTWSPEYSLEVERTGEHAMFVLQRTDGAEFKLSALSDKVQIGARSNHEVRFTTNNVARMTISAAGDVGIGNTSPGHKLVVGTSGAYCDGGAWVDGSSRSFKENIRDLSEKEALSALQELHPVKYNYKTNRSEEYLGFIAEDVPELVAMKDRKGMTAMDVVAVLTRVVQNQQKTIKKLYRRIEKLEKKK